MLVNGASGAVGSACVQIAKHLGAEVSAVCSGRNADLVTRLGADRVIDYTAMDFASEGILYDTVGSAPFEKCNPALRAGGRMVLIAGQTSDMLFGGMKARDQGIGALVPQDEGHLRSEPTDGFEAPVEIGMEEHRTRRVSSRASSSSRPSGVISL